MSEELPEGWSGPLVPVPPDADFKGLRAYIHERYLIMEKFESPTVNGAAIGLDPAKEWRITGVHTDVNGAHGGPLAMMVTWASGDERVMLVYRLAYQYGDVPTRIERPIDIVRREHPQRIYAKSYPKDQVRIDLCCQNITHGGHPDFTSTPPWSPEPPALVPEIVRDLVQAAAQLRYVLERDGLLGAWDQVRLRVDRALWPSLCYHWPRIYLTGRDKGDRLREPARSTIAVMAQEMNAQLHIPIDGILYSVVVSDFYNSNTRGFQFVLGDRVIA